jgi:hypothetical protein
MIVHQVIQLSYLGMPDKIIIRRAQRLARCYFRVKISSSNLEMASWPSTTHTPTQSSKFNALALFVSLSLTPNMIRVPFPRFLGNSYNWKAGEHLIDAMERRHGLRCASRRAPERCAALSCIPVHGDGLLMAS